MVVATRATVPTPSKSRARDRRIAVIDIGSNSIRLVVFDGLKRAPGTVFNEKVLCGLGRGVQTTGRLNPDGIDLAIPNLVRFTALVSAMGIETVDLIATAAVRDAEDGADFCRTVEEACGHSVRVLSGAEEAQLAALGVIAGTPNADGILGDLGGGSLELVEVKGGKIGRAITLALGPLRLMESCGDNRQKARTAIDETLSKVEWLTEGEGRTFYPVGGAWRNLARLHIEQKRHPLHAIHGLTIPYDEAIKLARLVSRQGKNSLSAIDFISRRRRETLPLASLVLGRVLRKANSEAIFFSTYGLREGYLFNQLSKRRQSGDPLLSAAREFAEREGRFGGLGDGLMEWCDALFPKEDEEERRLREAACHLSDFAWREHPDFRAGQAMRRLLHYPFVGIDHPGRSFLAYTVYLRYGGSPSSQEAAPATALLSERWRDRASLLGSALRLAFRVSGATRGILHHSRLNVDGSELELVLPEDGSVPDGEAVQRRLKALATVGGFDKTRIAI